MKRICLWVLVAALTLVLALPAAAATEMEINGVAAVLMDVATGQLLYEKNAHQSLPPASVTKVMTMLLIMEALDGGVLRFDDTVTASEAAAAKGGSQVYLKVGETMTVREMLKAVAVSSANDCACALAEKIAGSEVAFVEMMNQRAQELGMQDTHFVNCTGLDDAPEAAEHKTSAYDIAVMSRALMLDHPGIREFTTIWMDSVRDGNFSLANTNKLIRYYPGATGLKTGYTSKAGHCLSATAQRDGLELIAVVLGADSSQARFEDCKRLLDHGFATYTLIDPQPGQELSVPVRLGKEKTVPVVSAGGEKLLILKSQIKLISIQTALDPEVKAPVSKGQRLGTLTVKAADEVLLQVPLVAGQAVAKQSVWDIFCRLLGQICMAKADF